MTLIKVDVWGTLYARAFSYVYLYLVLKTNLSMYKCIRTAEIIAKPFQLIDSVLERTRIMEVEL